MASSSGYAPEFLGVFKPDLLYAQHPELMDKFTKRMQPDGWSQVGFLAPGQNLAEVCQKDAETLKARSITHEQIADRLEAVIMKTNFLLRQSKIFPCQAIIEDKICVPTYMSTHGEQECPFSDLENSHTICGTGSSMITIINLVSKKRLENITELHAHLIRDHHFFEGKHPYRLDPELAIDVLAIQPGVDYKIKTTSETVWQKCGSSSRIKEEELQAAREHKMEVIASEGGEFEAYILPYYLWSSYKYRGLTNRQKIEKQDAEKNKTPEQIQKDIEKFLSFEKDVFNLDGSPAKSRLDEQVWTSNGEQYLHIFKFKDLTEKDKTYKIGKAPITSMDIDDPYKVYKIQEKISPILAPGDRVEAYKKG